MMNKYCSVFKAFPVAAGLLLAGSWPVAGQEGSVKAFLSASTHSPFVHEEFTVELRLESEGITLGREIKIRGMPDDSIVIMGPPEELMPGRSLKHDQLRENRRFRWPAMCVTNGNIEITPEIEVNAITLPDPEKSRGRRSRSVILRPAPLTLGARPLPEDNRPESFSGAVGSFNLSVSVKPRKLRAGELVFLTVEIQGKGYLPDDLFRLFPHSAEFRVYRPRMEEEAPGYRKIRQVIRPETTRVKAIPRLTFTFFDPQSASYRTVAEAPLPLSVEPPRGEPGEPDIGELMDQLGRSEEARARAGRGLFLISGALLAGFAGIAVIILALIFKPSKGLTASVLTVIVGVQIVCLISAFGSTGGIGTRESVTRADTPARLAPGPRAEVTFEVPKGSAVSVIVDRVYWVKIAYGDNRGWIPSGSLLWRSEER
ncbi:MAG: SH3 domain-containing protein [Kiritimatiellia bacterium]